MNGVGWSKGIKEKENATTFGATLETAVLFLSLAITVNLAVYGWLGALGDWSSKESPGMRGWSTFSSLASSR